LFVMAYKFTGNSHWLDTAKAWFNRGTKGTYNNLSRRQAADNAVGHFIDTEFETSNGNFYLAHNKGELLYTYLIFENGGAPTVEGSIVTTLLQSIGPDNHGSTWKRYSDYSITLNDRDAAGGKTTQDMWLVSGDIRVVGTDGKVYTWDYSVNAWKLAAAEDTIPPTVAITPPASFVISGTITLVASASDNVGVVGVQFKLDDVNLGSEKLTTPYSITWNTTGTPNGTHT